MAGMNGVLLAPSILSADFGRLAEEVRAAEEAGADWIHVDVMDGHFVPNLTIGPGVTAAIRAATRLPVDVHLMIESPERYIEAFVDAGADRVTVHQEVCPHLHRVVERIRESGARPGVALNPHTPAASVEEILPFVDLLLIMTVNPGFGGQRFIGSSPDKIGRAGRLLASLGLEDRVAIQVDGGIDPETAPSVVGAGARVLVAGSAVFRPDAGVKEALAALRDAALAAIPPAGTR
jgi:ribulose-phosphate 3-epimerase